MHRSSRLLLAAVFAGTIGAAEAATPKDTLVMAWNIDNVISFDPAQIGETTTNEIFNNICDPLLLMDYTDSKKLIPGVAESWSIAPDGMTWTFKIRKGLKHPSGNPVTAADAAWSMQRTIKLNLGAVANIAQWGISKENVDDKIKALGEDTLTVTFDKPYPESILGPALFVDQNAAALDMKEIMTHAQGEDMGNTWLKTNTACVGPYHLRTWNANDTIILERNEGYWRGDSPIRRVIIRHVTESAAERLLLEKGDVDIARLLNPTDLAAIADNKEMRVVTSPRGQYYYMTLNNADPILGNPKVRLALRYLVDYEALQKTVMRFEGTARNSPIPLGAFGALSKEAGQPFKLDLAKAKQLLTEAGYPDGFSKEFAIGNTFPYTDLAQHIQANAEKVGVKLNINQMAYSQVVAKHRGRNFEVVMTAWAVFYPDAHGMAETLAYNPDNRTESRKVQYPTWRATWSDEWFNDTVQKALLEKDQAKRTEMYAEIQRRHMQEGPFVILFQTNRNVAVHNQVKDIKTNNDRIWYATAVK
ncbi:MAG: ABC transporter substrate-binding protein [Proteobacteria bacterium]|nr:ABC transporter substrate-binding protein [Pseudomonadota bacterium]MBI3497515.1 ABC transporter substrate-binding protein [Pseudomonadota bacterium]